MGTGGINRRVRPSTFAAFALRIIEQRRRRTAAEEGTHPSTHDVAIEKEQGRKLKIEEKKRVKQGLKRKKKRSG